MSIIAISYLALHSIGAVSGLVALLRGRLPLAGSLLRTVALLVVWPLYDGWDLAVAAFGPRSTARATDADIEISGRIEGAELLGLAFGVGCLVGLLLGVAVR